MKARGFIVIDYEFDNEFVEGNEILMKLKAAARQLAQGDNRVTFYDADIRERRGEAPPSLGLTKFFSKRADA